MGFQDEVVASSTLHSGNGKVAVHPEDHLQLQESLPPKLDPCLINRLAEAENYAFDIDGTLNRGRGQQITQKAAELIFGLILAGKSVKIITGRVFEEIQTRRILEPLRRKLTGRNHETNVAIYDAEGGGKVVISPRGGGEYDESYNVPFTKAEIAQVHKVVRLLDRQLDERYDLRGRNLDLYFRDANPFKLEWSPYGKADEAEYRFESCHRSERPDDRPTRKELGTKAIAMLHELGMGDFEARISGKTTIGFVRKGVSKEKAILDALAEGSVAYFGDEVAERGENTGNDHIVGCMAKKFEEALTVVSLDEDGGKIPSGVFHIGGLYDGTIEVLEEVLKVLQTSQENGSMRRQKMLEVLESYGLQDVSIDPLRDGHGIHEPFYIVAAREGQFVLRYVREDLFPDHREAARHEVWLVNHLRKGGIPIASVRERTDLTDVKYEEDRYIGGSSSGRSYLLYEYLPGKAGDASTMNDRRQSSMIATLAKMHSELINVVSPYERTYYQESIIDITHCVEKVRQLKTAVLQRQADSVRYALTRSERLVVENVDFIAQQLEYTREQLKPLYDGLPKVSIHSDFHHRNAIFVDDEVTGIFDLEHSRPEARLYDLTPMIQIGTENGFFNVERARQLVCEYHSLNPLTHEEVLALPEIFRLKLLDRISRLVNPSRHYEYGEFRFGELPPEEHTLMMIDKEDRLFSWYQGLIGTLRDLDARVTCGDFRRQIQEPLLASQRTGAEILSSQIKNLVEEDRSRTIELHPLSEFSLEELFARSRSIDEVYKEDKGNWYRDGNYYWNGNEEKSAWCAIPAGCEVLFYTDKVVAYRESDGDVYILVRGDDLDQVKSNSEKTRIRIRVDEALCAKEVHLDTMSAHDLSRSTMAIQLTDSGMFDRFPELHNLLKYQLVWQAVDGDLRHRELLDSYEIPFNLLRKKDLNADELSYIVNFRYLKSRVLRREALQVLVNQYDKGQMLEHHFATCVAEFLEQDLREDFRVIERIVKNDPQFVSSLFSNLYGMPGVRTDQIASFTIGYCDQNAYEEEFDITFQMRDGTSRVASVGCMRSDALYQHYGFDEDEIKMSIHNWQHNFGPGLSEDVSLYGSHAWEYDYRARTVCLGGSAEKPLRKKMVNNIAVVARQKVEGATLSELLASDRSDDEKRAAVEACLSLSQRIFVKSNKSGKGYFVDDPTPEKFVVRESPTGFDALLAGCYLVVDYPTVKMVRNSFLHEIPEQFRPELTQPGTVLH